MRTAPGARSLPLILAVDDDQDTTAFLAAALSGSYRVETAGDGREALERAVELLPDVILTDVCMPGMDGEGLIRAVRAHPRLARTAVVLVSAVDDEHRRARALREGAQDFVHKPIALEELRARLDNLIARKRAEEEREQLQGRLDRVWRASMSVFEALAEMPETSVDAVLETIARQAQLLTGARYAAVGIGTDPEAAVSPWAVVGIEEAARRTMGPPPRAVGVLGAVARAGRAIRVPDVRAHPDFRGLPAGHPEMSSFLGVPIRHRGRSVGNLYLAHAPGGPEFTESDQRMVEMMAAHAGVAIDTAHLYRRVGHERRWLSSVIEQIPEPVLMAETDTRTIRGNGAALALYPGDIGSLDDFGRPVPLDLRTPAGEPIPWRQGPLARALLDGRTTVAVELAIRRPDGTLMPVLASAVPVIGTGSPHAGAVAIFQDISALKKLESVREIWTGIVAHDLRQPISVIALAAEDLADALGENASPDDWKVLERLRRSAQRLDRMVEDLLDVSQIEAGRLTVTPKRVPLVPLVEETVARIAPVVRGHDVRVEVRGPSPVVDVDPGRLEQILSNLVTNAAKYGEAGAPIHLMVAPGASTVRISVVNRGPAIAPDELPRLFERFYRTASASHGAATGHGLGLFIVKGLVEAHGGRIEAESAGGETRMHLTLPLPGC